MSQPQPAQSGGSGGAHRRRIHDTRLIERALRERWPIPKALRKPLIARLAKIVMDDSNSPREVTSAAKAILTASKLNLESITATMKAQEHEELAERLTELENQVRGKHQGTA
jgi:hypothetical protein